MLKNSGKWLTEWALLWSILNCGICFAQEVDGFVHPATVVARGGGVDITAGKMLVQQGYNLNEWWQGEGTDADTQRVVKERILTLVNEAVRTELLQKAMVDMQARGGKEKLASTRPTLEYMEPIFRQELARKYRIEEWMAGAPEANNYITEWLATRVAAKIMAGLIAKKWYRQPERNAEAFAYWESHQDEFKVLTTGTWDQIRLPKDSPKIPEFERLFSAVAVDERQMSPLSRETFRQYGERITSEFPHPKIHPLIPKVFEKSRVGDQHRIPIGNQLVYLRLEQAEYRNGSYDEVALAVKDRLAMENEEKIVNTLFRASEPTTRVGLK